MTDPHDESLNGIVQLLDALNCGAVLLDRTGVIRHANARACEMMGREKEQVVGQHTESLYQSQEAIAFLRERITHFDVAHEGEFFVPKADGTKLPIILSGRRVCTSGPLSEYRLVTLIDISRQKLSESRAHEEYEVVSRLSDTVIEQALALKRSNETLEEKVRQRTSELHTANMEAIYMLAEACEAKDTDTGAHVRRIEQHTKNLSLKLGLPSRLAEEYGYSAILHDVGKMLVADHILKKPGPLDMDERDAMRLHCIAGERILSKKPFFEIARQIARSHHENWDGSGYPDGLSGERIPLAARIVHLADIYDALTSPRVYKNSWTAEAACEAIMEGTGVLFDPDVVNAFVALSRAGKFAVAMA